MAHFKNVKPNEAVVTEHQIINTSSMDCPDDLGYTGDLWDLERLPDKFEMEIKKWDKENGILEFDMIGLHPSIANALRRIIIAEATAMAIEKVGILSNTSLLQDEFLSHRLGLIPIRADSTLFNLREDYDPADVRNLWVFGSAVKKTPPENYFNVELLNPKENLLFALKVRCPSKRDSIKKKGSTSSSQPDPSLTEIPDGKVLSKHIRWVPFKDQKEWLKGDQVPKVVYDDILVAKLNPGQEIDVLLCVVKGVGYDHAKFSPVCTASYRLLPQIELMKSITGEQASRLQKCFSPGVIGIDSKGAAYVIDPRLDMISRNYLIYDDLKDVVRISFVKDHYMFSVESTRARDVQAIVSESIDILEKKCKKFIKAVKKEKRMNK